MIQFKSNTFAEKGICSKVLLSHNIIRITMSAKRVIMNIEKYSKVTKRKRERGREVRRVKLRGREEKRKELGHDNRQKKAWVKRERQVRRERGVLPDSLNKHRVILRRLNIIHPSSHRARR